LRKLVRRSDREAGLGDGARRTLDLGRTVVIEEGEGLEIGILAKIRDLP
jgi:hypothetical protein